MLSHGLQSLRHAGAMRQHLKVGIRLNA
jgi:hypothetical protein